MLNNSADLIGDFEFRHDLMSIDSRKDVNDCLSADVVAFYVQQLQRFVLMQRGRQCLNSHLQTANTYLTTVR